MRGAGCGERGGGGMVRGEVSAVMSEVELLEPSGLGHDLLTEWAAWARDDRDGRSSWSVKPRIAHGYHGDPPDRWFVVNRIVSRLLHGEKAFREVVKPYYLGGPTANSNGYSIAEIARMVKRSEQGVLVTLLHVCGIVEREYRDFMGHK